MTDFKKFIPNWGTPAMSVYATELACTKCHKDMGAIVRKFNSKYGEVKRYYMKFDVAVEVTL